MEYLQNAGLPALIHHNMLARYNARHAQKARYFQRCRLQQVDVDLSKARLSASAQNSALGLQSRSSPGSPFDEMGLIARSALELERAR